jgi:ribonuclease HI
MISKYNKEITIFTDGSCSHIVGDRHGGWAFNIRIEDGEEKINSTVFGCVSETTSARMELDAVRRALVFLVGLDVKEAKITIVSDSQYVIGTFNDKWYETWELRNYVGVKNEDILVPMIDEYKILIKNNWVVFQKVKGHSNDQFNDIVDKYAGLARQNLKKGIWEHEAIDIVDHY